MEDGGDLTGMIDEVANGEGSESSEGGGADGDDEGGDTLASTLPHDPRIPHYGLCSRRAVSNSALHRWQAIGTNASRVTSHLKRTIDLMSKHTRWSAANVSAADQANESQHWHLMRSNDARASESKGKTRGAAAGGQEHGTAKRRRRHLAQAEKKRQKVKGSLEKCSENLQSVEGAIVELTDHVTSITNALGDMRREAEDLLECFNRSQFAINVGDQDNTTEGPYPLPIGHFSESIFDMRSAVDKDDAGEWERTTAQTRR